MLLVGRLFSQGEQSSCIFSIQNISNPIKRERDIALTACMSQLAPSAIYLKQRSQTHKIDAFSPPPFRRSPPANMSDVRPCARVDERATPGIRAVDADGPEGWEEDADGGGSSVSCSVSGYGEKYLYTNESRARRRYLKHEGHTKS